jgi:hypothetical protein
LRIVVSGVFLSATLVAGCSEGTLEDTGDDLVDTGGDVIDQAPDVGQGDVEQTDVAPDTEPTDPGPPSVETFTRCGAGGVSKGGGMRAIQCYSPGDLGDREAEGGGVRWQPGAFRVSTE